MANITKRQNGITISGKDYVFTGEANIISNTSAHIVTDQGIIYVDTSATVENQNSADINTLLGKTDFTGNSRNAPEPILLASEFTQAQADSIAINSAKVGIASVGVADGNLTISLTDGTTPINTVNVVGPSGLTGATGPQQEQTGATGATRRNRSYRSSQVLTGATGAAGIQGIKVVEHLFIQGQTGADRDDQDLVVQLEEIVTDLRWTINRWTLVTDDRSIMTLSFTRWPYWLR
jgi:hypothetical protein